MSKSINNSFLGSSKFPLYPTSLTWTIDNFSQRSAAWVKSPPFTVDEKKDTFYLYLYPNKQDFVVLNLFMAGKKKIQIKVKLSLINSKGQKCLLYDQTGRLEPSTHSPKYVEMTVPKFISRTNLLQPSNGYLHNDRLTIHCEIEHLDNEKTTVSAIPSQADTMAKVFGTLSKDYGSLLKSGTFADVKLVVGGKAFPAHKSFLSARSSVFAAMFSHDMKESMENQVEITDIKPEIFETFLSFLYTGSLPTLGNVKSAEELLIVSDKYGCEQLKSICEDFLVSQLTLETAPNLLILANSMNAVNLKESALEFICNRGNELFDALKNEPDQLLDLFLGLAKKNQEKEQEKKASK